MFLFIASYTIVLAHVPKYLPERNNSLSCSPILIEIISTIINWENVLLLNKPLLRSVFPSPVQPPQWFYITCLQPTKLRGWRSVHEG